MQIIRRGFVFLCWAYLALLPVQFLLAGAGVMGGDLQQHMMFGGMVLHVIIPALMMVTALAGRLWSFAALAVLLFAILTLQVAMVPIGRELGSTLVAGLHPVVALLTWPYVYFVMLRPARARAAAAPPLVADETVPATA